MAGRPPPPPRLPPPPPSPFVTSQAAAAGGKRDAHHHVQQQQPATTVPINPPHQHVPHHRAPPPPVMINQSANNLQRQRFNGSSSLQHSHFQNGNSRYGAHSNTNTPATVNAASNQNMTSSATSMTASGSQQQPQYHRAVGANNNAMLSSMPPPPPPMSMPNNSMNLQSLQRQPPPPPVMMQHHQSLQQFSSNSGAMMQPPPLPPPQQLQSFPHPTQQQRQQQTFPLQQQQRMPPSTSSTMPPPPPQQQPSRPQYTNTNYPTTATPSSYSQPSSNPKIDPSQIPRIPLFTRPHHAPATIYPTHHQHQQQQYGSTTIGSSTTTTISTQPPPPLDSRYITNTHTTPNASPRILSTTVHTFPMDHATYRKCGDLPLGLICSPMGCLTMLSCSSGEEVDEVDDDDDGGAQTGRNANTSFANTTSSSSNNNNAWNGREQGDVYGHNITNRHSSNDVDYVISKFDGNGVMRLGGSSSAVNSKELEDPERIPVIRGLKRSVSVPSSDDAHHHHHHSTTTTTTTTTQTITPPRCNRCNAYLNPYCTPTTSSTSSSTTVSSLTNTFQGLIYTPTQSYNCNMCGSKSSIIIKNEEDIANQVFESTALKYGTVEYEVGGEYVVREGGGEGVFLYGVEYVPEGMDCSGIGGGGGHHHHHGSMKSHGWKESLDGIRNVAKELCLTAPRREGVRTEVKIGLFAFCQDMLVFPYVKRKGHDGGNDEEQEEEELAVAIVSDVIEDPFCPLPLKSWSYNVGEGLESKEWHRFCRVLDSFTELMEQLLEGSSQQPQHQQQQNDKWKRNCGGAALVALSDALKESGGRGTLITTRRPNYGVGALRDREAVTNYGIGSSTEQKLFTPLQHLVERSNDAVGMVKDKPAALFYKKLGEECAKNRVCLDIVVTSSSVSVPSTDPKQLQKNGNMREFLDVATLGELCRVTCGNFKWLRVGNECGVAVNGGFNDSFTGEQLKEELRRSALAYTGSDVVFKLRCSNGVQVKSYSPTLPVGNLVGDGIVNSAELELSSMHPGTSIAVVLEHKIGGVVDTVRGSSSRKGIDMPMVFFQTAVLYTTKTGQRRVRVSTLGLPTSKVPADIFRSADLGAVSTMLTRGAISDMERDGGSLRLARDNLFNKCVSILANYRAHTTARSQLSGQLILPESLQLLPLFCLSLRKSRILRHSLPKGVTSPKPFPTADERAYHIFYGRMVSPNMSLQCVHPHLFQVSDMRTRDGDWITPPVLQENKFDDANVIAASMKPVCQLPKTMNPSIACLDESGMYLLDDRFSFYLFIGRDVPDEKWQDLLSVGGVGSSRVRSGSVPTGGLSLSNTDSAHKLRSIIHQLRMLNSPNETLALTARNTYAPLILVFVGRGSVFEEEMDSLLVDDPDSHERSYVDFLCDIHRSVREKSDQT